MSKIQRNKINFNENNFLVENDNFIISSSFDKETFEQNHNEQLLQKQKIEEEYKKIIDEAKLKAAEIIEKAQNEANEIVSSSKEQIEQEKISILDNANKEAKAIIDDGLKKVEEERIEITKKGYDDGYQDGLVHIQEEQEENIKKFEEFCLSQNEIKEKIIKSATKEIVDIIANISRKILYKEIDEKIIYEIIKKAISLLNEKEEIKIVLSEKYAKLLCDLQNKNLNNEEKINFDNFKQFEGFKIIYNPNFDFDTIIVENLKERFDATISSQIEIIIQEIYDNLKDNKIKLEEKQDEFERTE